MDIIDVKYKQINERQWEPPWYYILKIAAVGAFIYYFPRGITWVLKQLLIIFGRLPQ